MVLKNYLILLSTLLLLSCGTTSVPEVEPVLDAPKILVLSPPSPLSLSDISWHVINSDNIIYYGLTIDDYKLLALNMEDIKRYISEQKTIILYYENVIGEQNGQSN